VNLADDGALCLDAVQLLQTDVEAIIDAPRLTIRQWREKYRTDRDHRMSDRWSSCLPLLITAWSSAPTSLQSVRSPAQTNGPQTRRSTGGSTTGGL
jgi:hypothetical protein